MDANETVDLTESWKRFKDRPFRISSKQKGFIVTLLKQLNIETDELIFVYLTEVLNRPIEKWEDLISNDVGRIIFVLKGRQKPCKRDMDEIKRLFTIDEINRIFSKQQYPVVLNSYDDLTHGKATLLLNRKKRFNNAYMDHPISSNMDHEYGWQESSLCQDWKMYYVKFYDLLMLDYDDLSYDEVIAILEPMKNSYYFEIHQTHNGYHVFLISRLMNHREAGTTALMVHLKCDHFYVLFCYNNGFKIRLSKKLDRDETFLSRVVGRYGNEALLNPECQNLLDIFHSFLKAESKPE